MPEQTRRNFSEIYQRSVKGGSWYIAGTVLQKALNVVPFLILARLLAPQDYGIITVVFTLTSFLERIATPGFGAALLQTRENVERHLDTVWTFDLIKAVMIALIIYYIGGPFASQFFHVEPRYEPIIAWSGILVMLSALSNSRQIYFFKELNFFKVFLRDTVGQIAYLAAAVGFALWVSASAWALFVGYVAKYVSGVIMSYALYPVWPRLSFAFRRLKELLAYSKWVYGHDLLEYVLAFLDTTLIGRLLGLRDLGLYTRARDLPATFTWPILSIIDKVGFSTYAVIQDRMDKIRSGFLRSLDILVLVSVPVALVLLLEGGSLVEIVLGRGWIGIVLPLKILAVGNLFLGLVTLVKPIFNAIGRPGLTVGMGVVQLVLSVVGIFGGIKWFGLYGAAIGTVAAWAGLFLYTSVIASRILQVPKKRLIPPVLSAVAGAIVTVAVAAGLRGFVHTSANPGFLLAWAAALGCLAVAVMLAVSRSLGEGPWRTIRSAWSAVRAKRE